MKTPEEYFLEKNFLPEGEGAGYTPAETAFLQKYMGWGEEKPQDAVSMPAPARVEAAPGFAAPAAPPAATPAPAASGARAAAKARPGIPDEPDILATLKNEEFVQLVGFKVGGQEFTVPIVVVQEVIRHVTPTQLPAAPYFLAGIINLRGRVTPLVRLRTLLGVGGADADSRFIVVVRRKGLQLGLMIDTVKTMYRMDQKGIEWGVESSLGANVEYVAGLMKPEHGKLVGVISIDRIVDKVLRG
ncbi:MAG: chemotaxis protein CheW [Thermodesulfobacteriota bacterium]